MKTSYVYLAAESVNKCSAIHSITLLIVFQDTCLELTFVENLTCINLLINGNLILQTNTAVIKLNLADNWISAEGAGYIAEMLRENCYISDLVIKFNFLAPGT